jgi:hypothetical protein
MSRHDTSAHTTGSWLADACRRTGALARAGVASLAAGRSADADADKNAAFSSMYRRT